MDRFFTYQVPADTPEPAPGCYLRVPWGKSTRGALVVRSHPERPLGLDNVEIREFLSIVEETALLDPAAWKLARWLREFYLGTWPQALQCLVPGPVLKALRRGSKLKARRGAEDLPLEPATVAKSLTPDQLNVWGELSAGLDNGATFLLHGVTGSGKTEIYLRACESILNKGLSAIVLVPEVSLTPQAQARFRGRFPQRVSILHSGLTEAERRAQWWRIRQGETPLVVGTRSAIFAPLKDLGLIIIDEEHDSSYKQGSDLRYHARQVAAWLSREHGATLLLGSATPCLESYALAKQGRYKLLSLPRRVHGRPMPTPQLVKGHGIPGLVLKALRDRAARGEQSVVLLNRRGFSRYLLCQSCGWVPSCSQCSISLTYHKSDRTLRCHYCGARQGAPGECEDCGGRHLDLPGKGTERVEAELLSKAPELRVVRLDRDTVGGKGSVFEETYRAFEAGEYDCLLGTQMVAKGLDFPSVSLVVVLEADTGLHIPDFRAAERTFALLTQVSGRAGRGSIAGEVMLVCQKPDHPLFRDLIQGSWERFMASEMELRRSLAYPPYRRMLRIVVSDPKNEKAEEVATLLGEALQQSNSSQTVDILGPAPCPLEKLQGRYRWHILLKALRVQDLHNLVRKSSTDREPWGARVTLDPDPLELL